jgi:hypothetical protein
MDFSAERIARLDALGIVWRPRRNKLGASEVEVRTDTPAMNDRKAGERQELEVEVARANTSSE